MKESTDRIRKFFNANDFSNRDFLNFQYGKKALYESPERTTDTSRFQIRKGKMYFDGEELIFATCGTSCDHDYKDNRIVKTHVYGGLSVVFYGVKSNRIFEFFESWLLAFSKQSNKEFKFCFEYCKIVNLE